MTKIIEVSDGLENIKLKTSWMHGYCFQYVELSGWGTKTTTYTPDDVDEVQEVTEENYRSLGTTAAWAVGAGLLTGGIGFIAGAAFGGRKKKSATYLVRFSDGKSVAFHQKHGSALKAFQKALLKKQMHDQIKGT